MTAAPSQTPLLDRCALLQGKALDMSDGTIQAGNLLMFAAILHAFEIGLDDIDALCAAFRETAQTLRALIEAMPETHSDGIAYADGEFAE